MSLIQITPQPTDAEVAAILVAYEALWPRPAAIEGSGSSRTPLAVQRPMVDCTRYNPPPKTDFEAMTADPVHHPTLDELEAALDHIRQAPSDHGTLELIVRRPCD